MAKDSAVNTDVEQQYSFAEVADLLSVDRTTVHRLHKLYQESGGKEGMGPAYKIGRRVMRMPASAVNGFLKSKRTTI